MKAVYFLLLILFFSCSNPEDEPEKVDKAPIVNNSITDITVEEGLTDTVINLTDVFTDEDNPDSLIIKEAVSNSNTSLLTILITNNSLKVNFVLNQTGFADITVKGTSNGKSVEDKFRITVSENKTLAAINMGKAAISGKNYTSALNHFQTAVSEGDSRYIREAYLGLAFSQIKRYQHTDAYSNLDTGLNLPGNNFADDFNMLFCLMEYSFKKDYSLAISKGLSLLNQSTTFSMHLDSTLNEKDIRVTVAMAYYKSQDYVNSINQIKILDSTITLSVNDSGFEYLLANELNRLVNLYK